MILLIDNYDSFSYNLYQLIGQVNSDIQVSRNDKITIEEIRDLNPEAIILSPGPGKPENAGICMDLVKEFHDKGLKVGLWTANDILSLNYCRALGVDYIESDYFGS